MKNAGLEHKSIMNKLLQLFPRNEVIGGVNVKLQAFAILETPCYPASWYFGPVEFAKPPQDRTGEWQTMNNATSNFHRSLEQAEDEAIKFLLFFT